ncbi:MAG: DUF5668 domain-containing protein [Bryobacteraceae bacterium]
METFQRHICSRRSGSGGIVLALFLILTGVVVLLRNLGYIWIDRVWDLWPVALIAAGLAGLVQWGRERNA